MRDYRDAKAMARRLREALAQRDLTLTHTDCLELIARSFGVKDWQVLAAMIEAAGPAEPAAAPPAWSGPVLLLRDIVVFPKMTVPIFIGRSMSKLALANAYQGEQEVLLLTQRDPADNDPGPDAVYRMGVIADVLERNVLPAGEVKLLVRARQRAAVLSLVLEDGFRRAEATPLHDARVDRSAAEKLLATASAALADYAGRGDVIAPDVAARLAEIRSPGVLADLIAANAKLPIADRQAVLETDDIRQRLETVVRLISHPGAKAA